MREPDALQRCALRLKHHGCEIRTLWHLPIHHAMPLIGGGGQRDKRETG